jgi:hypothetical protein
MSATMTPQSVADALIMAMPEKWRSVCTLSLSRRKRLTRRCCRCPGFSSALANAIITGVTCGYLQIQYGVVGL